MTSAIKYSENNSSFLSNASLAFSAGIDLTLLFGIVVNPRNQFLVFCNKPVKKKDFSLLVSRLLQMTESCIRFYGKIIW